MTNEGFLRDQQGVQTLEVVQKFYEIIKEEPEKATLKISTLLDFCGQSGDHVVETKPVLTLTRTENGITSGHAVVLKSYYRSEEYLDLMTTDSLSDTGETTVQCSIFDNGGQEILVSDELPGEWSLSSEKCYYLHFN